MPVSAQSVKLAKRTPIAHQTGFAMSGQSASLDAQAMSVVRKERSVRGCAVGRLAQALRIVRPGKLASLMGGVGSRVGVCPVPIALSRRPIATGHS